MSFSIAVSGKGGTGKTTIAGLILKELLGEGRKPVLVIDADHDGNLAQVLGIEEGKTVGEVVEELQEKVSQFPPGFSKDQWLEARLQEVMVEEKGFDFLSMGRGEGPGCYCYVNSVLRRIMDTVTRDYPYILMDNAAGMEHLSRRTTRDVDVLLVVSDHSMKGVKSAARIAELAKELDLKIGRIGLLINRAPGEVDRRLMKEAEGAGLEILGVIPEDEEIAQYDLEGRSLLELPGGNAALKQVRGFLEKVLIN
ncbi:MAG: hypothetical protein DRG33_03620 [Deltaproteobacteria bacterium]|nr:MAG: hypothetical protein DRG33_03620 [Deltaproteobacteria bacterium]